MGVNRRVLQLGLDSWEGDMTYRGITFMVEAMERRERGETGWSIEVLRKIGRHTVQPLFCAQGLTLEAALNGAERAIRRLVDGD